MTVGSAGGLAFSSTPEIYMSLLDLIRPQWKHSNPEVRASAVQNLGPENQEIFATIIQNDASPKVRQIAVRKITSSSLLRSLLQDSDADIRQFVSLKVQEDIARSIRQHEGALTEEIRSLLTELKSGQILEDVLRNARSSEVRLALVKQYGKPGLLSQVALRDPDEEVALAAAQLINRENLLQDVADHSRHPLVRSQSADRLRTQFSKATTASQPINAGSSKPAPSVPQEDPTLRPKRQAVIAHALRLLDTRDFLVNEVEFKLLAKDAEALGLGDLQDDFERLQLDFTQRADQQRQKVQEDARQAEDRVQKLAALQALVSEFEGVVNEGATSGSASQVQAMQARFRDLGGESQAELSKRFQSSLQRYQRVAQQVEQAQNSQADEERQKSHRVEVLEQLKLLLDKEDLDSVERQLRGLVREWEYLPLLEGEDAQLQSYNHLRDQLASRMRERDDSRTKFYEDQLAQLRSLIERVNSIDENQDFKEISKILRQTYLEWRDIVGDDKYQFHDIWKEYRAATARFEEMKEWESWRNEQERDHIIKEIEALLTVEDAPEAMARLRHWQQTWKDAGFVPQPKLQEFWDRYKAVTEQVMTKFHTFIEEQNQQKQVNLDAKIEFCGEVERIAADTTDQWKDKAKRVQQLQDEWKQAGPVPRDQNQPIWDRFRAACDAFYVKHKEYLAKEDGERRINLERKTALCVQAEGLIESADWNGTTNRLRKLQEEWKAVGPVPKAQSEEIWVRFRTACDNFFGRKRLHFDEIDAEKGENYKKKIALCERLEALVLDPSNSEAVSAVDVIDAEWKTIGMVPKEQVDELWDRYCAITDKFLEKRAASDPALQQELRNRLDAKKVMLDRVKELCDEAGSNQASDAVRTLQDEWKQIGRSGTQEQELYHQFRQVCDEFFERRRDQLEIQEQARKNNLQRKILLIEQAERLLESGELNEESLEEVKHLRRLWKEVGAVPREQSDRIWKRFNTACDAVFTAVRGDYPAQNDRGQRPVNAR